MKKTESLLVHDKNSVSRPDFYKRYSAGGRFFVVVISVIVNAFLEIMLPHEELRDYPECTQS